MRVPAFIGRSPARSWLQIPRPVPNPRRRLRLICFHHAGGSAAVFHPWAEALPADVELVAVQPPGRANRIAEPPYRSLGALLDALEEVMPPLLQQPYACFGHSMGATVAYELSQRLRKRGLPLPERLILSGRPAPSRMRPRKPIHALPEAEFLQELRGMNGTPDKVLSDRGLMELLLPVIRADFEAVETWDNPDWPPLPVDIIAVGGDADPKVGRDELDGWAEHTSGDFRRMLFPGDHFYLQQCQPELLAALNQWLRG